MFGDAKGMAIDKERKIRADYFVDHLNHIIQPRGIGIATSEFTAKTRGNTHIRAEWNQENLVVVPPGEGLGLLDATKCPLACENWNRTSRISHLCVGASAASIIPASGLLTK